MIFSVSPPVQSRDCKLRLHVAFKLVPKPVSIEPACRFTTSRRWFEAGFNAAYKRKWRLSELCVCAIAV